MKRVEDKSIEEIRIELDKMYDELARKQFDRLLIHYSGVIINNEPMNNYTSNDIQNMIKHFESSEEYEKCAFLFKLSEKVSWPHDRQ